MRERGRVKFFNTTKGFGFITPDNGSADLFVHVTQLQPGTEINEGDAVEYEIVAGKKGEMAGNVVRLSGADLA